MISMCLCGSKQSLCPNKHITIFCYGILFGIKLGCTVPNCIHSIFRRFNNLWMTEQKTSMLKDVRFWLILCSLGTLVGLSVA